MSRLSPTLYIQASGTFPDALHFSTFDVELSLVRVCEISVALAASRDAGRQLIKCLDGSRGTLFSLCVVRNLLSTVYSTLRPAGGSSKGRLLHGESKSGRCASPSECRRYLCGVCGKKGDRCPVTEAPLGTGEGQAARLYIETGES